MTNENIEKINKAWFMEQITLLKTKINELVLMESGNNNTVLQEKLENISIQITSMENYFSDRVFLVQTYNQQLVKVDLELIKGKKGDSMGVSDEYGRVKVGEFIYYAKLNKENFLPTGRQIRVVGIDQEHFCLIVREE